MWVIKNQTRYAAERNWVRDKNGGHHWVIAVKATFDVGQAGAVKLAAEQSPPPLAPEYTGETGRSSLRHDSDLLYIKPQTDVVVLGNAHAPRGRACAATTVSLRIGSIHKQLLVHGPRVYQKRGSGISITSGRPFEIAPMDYECAYGGTDTSDPDPRNHQIYSRNPVGKGFALEESKLVDRAAATVEFPGKNSAEAGPAGFGPIDAAWSPRREYGGTYDDAWARTKKPLLPSDYHELYGSCAPSDQRVPELHGGELVELVGMTREGTLRFALPKVQLKYATHFGGQREEHQGKLVTVLILPEQAQVAMTWQTTLPVASRRLDYLDHSIIAEQPHTA